MTALFPVTAADVADTNDDWYTPPWIFDAAGLVFDLDVAAPVAPERRTCPARRYLTVLDDGLAASWEGLVWMNPPYSAPKPWADRWLAHENGIALFPWTQSVWMGALLGAVHGFTVLSGLEFLRPNGGKAGIRYLFILAGMGAPALEGMRRVAAKDRYAQGNLFGASVRGAS